MKSLKCEENKQKFTELFNYYAELLNINEIFQKEANNMIFLIIIGDEKKLFKVVKESFGLIEQSMFAKCLNERKLIMDWMKSRKQNVSANEFFSFQEK